MASLFLLGSQAAQANSPTPQCSKQPEILFFLPNLGHPFWSNAAKIMQIAAKKHNIKLTIYYMPNAAQNRFFAADEIENYLQTHKKPDLIGSFLWYKAEERVIKLYNDYNIPFFTINAYLDDKLLSKIGQPRKKYRRWLGHISPNDYKAGYDLLENLITASQISSTQPISVLAFGGELTSSAAVARKQGFEASLKQHKNASLLSYIPTTWLTSESEQRMTGLLKRAPKVDIIWHASDSLAIGTANAISNTPTHYLDNVKIGGIDWSQDILPPIKRKKVNQSLGGHILEATWAMLMLYDYYNGKDFADKTSLMIQSELSAINQKNITNMLEKLKEKNWHKLNYKQFSQCLDRDFTRYSFSPSRFFTN